MPGKTYTKLWWPVCMALVALFITGSQASAEEWGPKIGTKAPEFKLKDQANEAVSLQDLLRTGPVAIVFYRSASW